MKLERCVSGIWGVILGCMLSLSCVMCMVSAFDLQINVNALAVCCVLSSLVWGMCYVLPLKLLPVSVGALLLGYFWRTGALEKSVEALLNRLSRQYNKAYGWGIIRWGYRTADQMEPTMLLILCILGALVAMAAVWSVCRGKTALPAVFLSILCAGTCFVVTDTLPDVVWLYFLLLSMIVLLLTGQVRQQDEKQGNRLSLFAVPVTALALLLLLVCIPQSTYNGQDRADKLTKMFFTDPMQLLMGKNPNAGSGSGNVDLTTVGFRNSSDAPVMEVTADFDALLYLRGRAMNIYDGTSWQDSAELAGEWINWEMLDWPEMVWESGIVKISTRYAHRMVYTPYYLRKAYMKDAGAGIINKTGMTEYSFNCLQIEPDVYDPFGDTVPPSIERGDASFIIYPEPQEVVGGWTPEMLEQFIYLPDSVRRWAEPLAEEITEGISSPYHKALAIAEYVKNSAAYNTKTPAMPGRYRDFARWFLENSDTGYCVHFASSAAVLLQASGIPARYVTGYTAQVTAGETTIVTADKAHAWTEYYLPGFGWTVLEATPAQEVPVPEQTQDATDPSQDAQAPTQEQETTPVQDPVTQTARKYGKVVRNVLVVMAVLAAFAAALWGQYQLRLYIKMRRRSRLSANELTLVRWHETVRYARLLGQMPEKELFALAEKARFSQHTITEQELALFDAYAESASQALKKRSLLHRFYYRIILTVY